MKSGNGEDVIYKEVVVIGNGPSGIALSYMLSGNLPFLISTHHPDEMLSMRLSPALDDCLLNYDLEEMAAGLEGRSNNPVSLLMDALLHPCADIGMEIPPMIEFRKVGTEIDHVVLGNGPPGGSWHKMDPYILTLSLGSWMSLPSLPFTARDSGEKRAFASNVANYYLNYVKEMDLERFFNNNVQVTRVERKHHEAGPPDKIYAGCAIDAETPKSCPIYNAFNYILSRAHHRKPAASSRCCKRTRDDLCQGSKVMEHTKLIKDQEHHCCNECENLQSLHYTVQRTSGKGDADRWLVEAQNVESGESTSYLCKYLVLANGASDRPNKLEVSRRRKEPTWLFHDLRSLERNLDDLIKTNGGGDVDPVLIVGAGLSAADAVIAVRERNVTAVHIFRNKMVHLNRQLPENMYPEYHKVHQMMQDGGSSYPNYLAYPEYNLFDIEERSRSVILTSKSGETLKMRVSFAVVLIGSRPDLHFLPSDFRLGVNKDLPIDCKTNPVCINKLTHQVEGHKNLFAIGPLAGDHFVRFIPGGAVSVIKELYQRDGTNHSCTHFKREQ